MSVVITMDISLRHCVLWYVFIVVTEVKKNSETYTFTDMHFTLQY